MMDSASECDKQSTKGIFQMSKDSIAATEEKAPKASKSAAKAGRGEVAPSGKAQMIRFGDIEINEEVNVRKTYDKKRIESLAQAMLTEGQLDPFLVGPKDPKTGKHLLTAGFRRSRAHILNYGDKANDVLVSVNVKEFKSADEALLANMSFDEGREPIKRYELADRLHYMATSLGFKGVDLAKRINMSNATVSNLITCRTKLAPEILEAWKNAPSAEQEIPISRLTEWAAYPHEDQLAAFEEYMAPEDDANNDEDENKASDAEDEKEPKKNILLKPLGKKAIIAKLEEFREREGSLTKTEAGAFNALRWVLQETKTLRLG